MFSVRNLTEEDYDILVEWWRKWKWTPVSRDFLPQNGTGGIIVYKNDTPIVAGFLYLTNSSVAWCEFIVSNFEYKNKDRKEAIKILIHELTLIAENCGAKYVYTVVKNENLRIVYEEMGYSKGSSNVQEMVKVLV